MLKRNLYYLGLIMMSHVFLSRSYERRNSKQCCKETYYSQDSDGVSFRNLAEAHDTISYCSKCHQYHELISTFEDSWWLWLFRDSKNFLILLESFPSHHLIFFFKKHKQKWTFSIRHYHVCEFSYSKNILVRILHKSALHFLVKRLLDWFSLVLDK